MAQQTDPAYEGYEEVVRAPRWMVWFALGCSYLAGVAVESLLASPTLSGNGRLVSAIAMVTAGFVIGVAGFLFSRLRVHVDRSGVRFGFGPFASNLRLDGIVEARPVPYQWERFGGWGVRWSWNLRDRAYSVPFVGAGVEIRLASGRSYFVSSRHPYALVGAIDALTGRSTPVGAL